MRFKGLVVLVVGLSLCCCSRLSTLTDESVCVDARIDCLLWGNGRTSPLHSSGAAAAIPILFSRRQPARFASLLDRRRLMALWSGAVSTESGHAPARINDDFRLVKRVWSSGSWWSAGLPSFDQSQSAQLEQKLSDGFTFVFNRLELRDAGLWSVCDELATASGVRVCGINGYLSPSNACGFALHHDRQDAFVAQLSGRKRWRVCESWPAPLIGPWQEGKPPAEADKDCETVVLSAGDSLFLPRGVLHDADTVGFDESSLHVTIGLSSDFQMACELLHALVLTTTARDDAHSRHLVIRAAASHRVDLRRVVQHGSAAAVRAAMIDLRAFVDESDDEIDLANVRLPVVGLIDVYVEFSSTTRASRSAVSKWLQDVTDEQAAAAAQLFDTVLTERTALLRAKKDGLLNRDREL
jgi:hypothetical protein